MFDTGAEVEVFDLTASEGKVNHGVTTMTAAPELSLYMGYTDVTFFGGDSCFRERDYAYDNPDNPRLLRMTVSVGSELFETDPELLMQAEFLAQAVQLLPKHFKEKSGGLFRALVGTDEYDIVNVSDDLQRLLVAA